ncbi:MAG: ABC transporter substrate-binding protein, partial [Akkermansiaceae bacterium]|nr:ABC transporter substrate-binding protein [Akkermansiaceae bacterium]
LEPALALTWKTINPTTWEFKLRRGVVYHDGTKFTADDVVFSFKRAQMRARTTAIRSTRSPT